MEYLSKEQILLIHSMIIDETGGLHGVRDFHAVLSLEQSVKQSVFGKELFPTVFEKAAVYARDIIMNHMFLDGNKRTGMTVASVFLEVNNFVFKAKDGEIEKFALKVVSERLTISNIATWLEIHSKTLQKD